MGKKEPVIIDELQERRNAMIRKKVEEISNRLMEERDPIIAGRLEQALDTLHKAVPPESRKVLTIDDIKRRAMEARRTRFMDRKRQQYLWVA